MLHDVSTTRMADYTSALDLEEVNPSSHVNDDLDDVFGSAPGSPDFHSAHQDDDAFERGHTAGGNTEYSDIPRLKEKHETEGYRDGVTRGKSESVQRGFDEGYGLGATLGLKIGKILGLLEGICGALSSAVRDAKAGDGVDWEGERVRVEKLCVHARGELGTQSVFGKEWWGEDGIWSFAIPGEREEGREVLFPDVVAAHPLVVKWEGIVKGEIERWGLDLSVLEYEDDERDLSKAPKAKEESSESMAPGAKKELAW